MDPVETGEWLASRPHQLIFITGIDAANRPGHGALLNALLNRKSAPLKLRLIDGELTLPVKTTKRPEKGILGREWAMKYTERIPALIVLFVALEWDDASWQERKTEAESKVESVRSAAARCGSRVALVLLQERSLSHADSLATERAAELCTQCQLSPKQLFVLPTSGDLQGYIGKLESALHELAQGFYQQKIKTIRARCIPNNSPPLLVRQMFKLAFLSELKQDTHTALRNYKLAYEQCREQQESWDSIDVFEWRSVVGLLNYKMCDLCFLHSTALEAITQMRRHITLFFHSQPGSYPSPQLASIEYELWKSKQCWNFAELFERAVVNGLTALPTLNPGSHLDAAAAHYSKANREIAYLKSQLGPSPPPYPSNDPLIPVPRFFGQRPWRVGCDGLAPANVEHDAVVALQLRLRVNHDGVLALLTGAVGQYKKYGCYNTQRKMLGEMAHEYSLSGDWNKSLQLLAIVLREQLPLSLRSALVAKAVCSAWMVADIKHFVMTCAMGIATEFEFEREDVMAGDRQKTYMHSLLQVLSCSPPSPPEGITEPILSKVSSDWTRLLSEPVFFSIVGSPPGRNIPQLVSVSACFLPLDPIPDPLPSMQPSFSAAVRPDSKVAIRVSLRLNASFPMTFSRLRVGVDIGGTRRAADDKSLWDLSMERVELKPKEERHLSFVVDLSEQTVPEGCNIVMSRVSLEMSHESPRIAGILEWDAGGLPLALPGGFAAIRMTSRGSSLRNDGVSTVNCLCAEVVSVPLRLTNLTNSPIRNLRLDSKRPQPPSSVGMAVLFVDEKGELLAEYSKAITDELLAGQTVEHVVKMSTQMVGTIDKIPLEARFTSELGEESCGLGVSVRSKEAFSVNSSLLNINGVPVTTILNYNEHILKVDVHAKADMVVTKIEWLLADFAALRDETSQMEELEDEMSEDDIASYEVAIVVRPSPSSVSSSCSSTLQPPPPSEGTLSSASSDSSVASSAYSAGGVNTINGGEKALGRVCIEWKRRGSPHASVRSVIPLLSLVISPCPVSISATVFPSARPPLPGQASEGNVFEECSEKRCTAGAPMGLEYRIESHHHEPLSLQCTVEVPDVFLFAGKRQSTVSLLPGSSSLVRVIVMAQSAGRLSFPRLVLKSSSLSEKALMDASRGLPAYIFTLPMAREVIA